MEQIEQGFQNKLEYVDRKLKQVKLRSKMLKNKINAFRSLKQFAIQNLLPTKAVMESNSDNPNKKFE